MATPEGFTEFVVARQAALLRTAYLLTGHAQDAEDLVQTTLVKVVPQWRRIGDNPEPYVRRVLVNENVSRWRRRRWREAQPPTSCPRALADEPGPRRAARRARRAAGTLAPRQRAVLVLRYYEGLSRGGDRRHARDRAGDREVAGPRRARPAEAGAAATTPRRWGRR